MSQADLFRIKPALVAARLAQTAVILAILGTVLFLAAGRLDWWEAWIFLAVYFAIAEAAAMWILYRDPGLSAERSRTGKNVKTWDKVLVSINLLLTLTQWAVIGLDAGRFGWSVVPVGVRLAACLLMLLSFGLTLWASQVNTFLSGRVRIQSERGHHAITAGPYHYVRHPMYVAMILLDLSLPLVLGSLWALLVSGCMIFVVVVRTALEDKTLRAELPGYRDFVQEVRYRLIPGVW